jgi:hypothetical protein
MQDDLIARAHTRSRVARTGSGHQDEGFERIEKKLVTQSLRIGRLLSPKDLSQTWGTV